LLSSVICYLPFVIAHALLPYAFDLSQNFASAHVAHLVLSCPGGRSRAITLSVVIAISIPITGSLGAADPNLLS
jgi:hypothetical protein